MLEVVPAAQKPAPFEVRAPQWLERAGGITWPWMWGRLWKLVRGTARGEEAPLDVKVGGALALIHPAFLGNHVCLCFALDVRVVVGPRMADVEVGDHGDLGDRDCWIHHHG